MSNTKTVQWWPLVDLDPFLGKVKYDRILEYKISWKVLQIFAQECSNDDLGLTLSFFMARSNLLSGFLYGKRSWIL